MKLDAGILRYLSANDYRALTAVEIGLRNHEVVPVSLLASLCSLPPHTLNTSLSLLHKHKLLHHESVPFHSYRLTNLGYDILALHTLVARHSLVSVGERIGVGKEADVFSGFTADEQPVIIKLHRCGRTSFRAIKNKRDYLQNRVHTNWFYMSRLSAQREYSFLTLLYAHGFTVPKPVDSSRHVIVMQYIPSVPLYTIPSTQYTDLVHAAAHKSSTNQSPEETEEILPHQPEPVYNESDDDDDNDGEAVEDSPFSFSFSPAALAAKLTAEDIESLYRQSIVILKQFISHGLIHCDLNEFNLLVTEDFHLVAIDFPQLVSTSHPNAEEYFQRDLDGITLFFERKFGYVSNDPVRFEDITLIEDLGNISKASGANPDESSDDFEKLLESMRGHNNKGSQDPADEIIDSDDDEYDDDEEEDREIDAEIHEQPHKAIATSETVRPSQREVGNNGSNSPSNNDDDEEEDSEEEAARAKRMARKDFRKAQEKLLQERRQMRKQAQPTKTT